MYKKNLIFMAALAFSLGSHNCVIAQNETDALRYSQLQFGGTARIQGMAGAQTALGGDIGTLSGNPAGIAFYRRNDLSMTMGLTFGNTNTTYLGTNTLDNKGSFNIPSLGLVLTNYRGDDYQGNWKSTSFGFSLSRQAHLHNRFSFSGINNSSSITQYLAQTDRSETSLYNEGFTNEFYSLEGMAYSAYLINPNANGNGFSSIYATDPETGQLTGNVRQTEEVVGSGAVNQWDIVFGGNYRNKLFLGGSLGIIGITYEQERTFREYNQTAGSTLRELKIQDQFKTSGNGVNLKLGAIFKPTDWVNLGVTIQTPTATSLNDSYSSELSAEYNSWFVDPAVPGDTVRQLAYNYQSIPGTFNYNLTSPFRASGGVAFFIKKSGFISADVEYVNYSQSRFSATSDSQFPATNSLINTEYQPAVNLRIGGEYRYDIFRARLGFAHYGDPYTNVPVNRSRTYITGGAGIRQDNFYLDLAYVHSSYNSVYQPYTLNHLVTPAATTKNTYGNYLATVGFTF